MNNNIQLLLQPEDNQRLANLCGPFDEHLRQLEKGLGIEIHNRGNTFKLIGEKSALHIAQDILEALYVDTKKNTLTANEVHLYLQSSGQAIDRSNTQAKKGSKKDTAQYSLHLKRGIIKARGAHQQQYLDAILRNDINFGIGPAGTGKTYLAVACAVQAWEHSDVRRIILTRPAVEAGEKLGFLPGDLAQKVDPYLRPLYDALYEMLGFEQVDRLIEKNVIEVAPLAFMRGRSLNESFIILDEAQNTTTEQMKMFLTRIGFGSKAVVTGDLTQIDLPSGRLSGLKQALTVLEQVSAMSFTYFTSKDVVRHPLVQRIVDAYDQYEDKIHEAEKNSN